MIYDRLGVGESDKPDGYNVVQGPVQVEILRQIITLARNGKLSNAIHKPFSVPRFDKVIGVGHSMGSIFTSDLIALYGNILDGTVLTGYIPTNKASEVKQQAHGLEFAAQNDPKRFADRPSGYLVSATVSNVQLIFFGGNFEPELLEYADSIKDTSTVGETVESRSLAGQPAPDYSGPILVSWSGPALLNSV